MGYNSNLSWASYQARGWSEAGLVSYMESHDEERLMFKNLEFGNFAGDYSIKDLNTALQRMELVTTFHLGLPGPKMIWQFGELGYDYSIYTCWDGTVDNGNTSCKLDPKPIRWDYWENPNRRRLWDVNREWMKLRKEHSVFRTSDYEVDLASVTKKRIKLNDPGMNAIIIGCFDVNERDIIVKNIGQRRK